MSLFIDVIEDLSSKIKNDLMGILEREIKNQDRPVRKICDSCTKYLDYGELRYDKMEDGIARLKDDSLQGNALKEMLMAVLHESLDEDQAALEYFTAFSDSSLAEPFHSALRDFIDIAKFVTLKDYSMLENTGIIMIERYTNENTITDTISNLYLKAEDEAYIPVFQRLVARAKELYPSVLSLEGLCGFINMKGKDYQKALESFLVIKERLEQDKDDPYYDDQLASAWDNIADCYLKLEDAARTIESCDIAIEFDRKAETIKLGYSPLYKKAEALLLAEKKEEALNVINQILNEHQDDEKALEIKQKISG